jgi:hypothetical protein
MLTRGFGKLTTRTTILRRRADEADDVFFIIRIVGVAGDAAGRRGDSVLIWYWSMVQSRANLSVDATEEGKVAAIQGNLAATLVSQDGSSLCSSRNGSADVIELSNCAIFIADQFKMSPDLVGRILEFARTGKRPEWSPSCTTPRDSAADVKNEPKYVQFASTVAELHDIQRLPLKRIPAEIEATFGVKISENTVGNAYKYAQAVARRGGNLSPAPYKRLT